MADSDAATRPDSGRLDEGALEGFSYLLGQPEVGQPSTFLAAIKAARPVLPPSFGHCRRQHRPRHRRTDRIRYGPPHSRRMSPR